MWYSRQHDILYVRVPNTGSSTLLSSARKACGFKLVSGLGDHDEADRLLDVGPYAGSRRVGFVRHPLDWVSSVWAKHGRSILNRYATDGYSAPRYEVDVDVKMVARWVKTPFDWFMRDGVQVIDEVWRSEDLVEFLVSLGLEPPGQRLGVTDRAALPVDVERIVRDRFEREWAFYPEGVV